MMHKLPSQDYLNECFEYQPATGLLIWKERSESHFFNRSTCKGANARYAGKIAGNDRGCRPGRSKSYLRVHVAGKNLFVHRIIWKMLKNEEPPKLDHVDGDSKNNRIENLRRADDSLNARSVGLTSHNTSGHKGVYQARSGKWCARIRIMKKDFHLGTFADLEAAKEAYKKAAENYHGEFVRLE